MNVKASQMKFMIITLQSGSTLHTTSDSQIFIFNPRQWPYHTFTLQLEAQQIYCQAQFHITFAFLWVFIIIKIQNWTSWVLFYIFLYCSFPINPVIPLHLRKPLGWLKQRRFFVKFWRCLNGYYLKKKRPNWNQLFIV